MHDLFLSKALQSPYILQSQGVTRPRLSVVFGPCKALKDTSHHAGLKGTIPLTVCLVVVASFDKSQYSTEGPGPRVCRPRLSVE